jgi:hypothetical protein
MVGPMVRPMVRPTASPRHRPRYRIDCAPLASGGPPPAGQIRPDLPGAPSLECIARWTALRDLSLSAAPDDEDRPYDRYNHHRNDLNRNRVRRRCGAAALGATRPAACGGTGPSEQHSGTAAGAEASSGGGGGDGGVDVPCMYGDDEGGSDAADAAGALDLGVDWFRCLPAGLTRLALSGVRVRGGELLALLAGSLTELTSLQVRGDGSKKEVVDK